MICAGVRVPMTAQPERGGWEFFPKKTQPEGMVAMVMMFGRVREGGHQ